ncbi:hypothetical protein [Cytobacillus oceanisediminis]|nr:hypothetical protein [Cytobacillus oceanisediminis]
MENPWFVGIGGGIISGLFVFYMTNFIFNKINKKTILKGTSE